MGTRKWWVRPLGLVLVFVLVAGLGVSDRRVVVPARFAYLLSSITPWVPTVQKMLRRRAAAVAHRDEAGFLADVDRSDAHLVRREKEEFQNLLQLRLSHFELSLTTLVADAGVPKTDSPQRRFAAVSTLGVTVHYAIDGVDSRPVAAPWVLTIGFTAGRWVIASDVTNPALLPYGAGGQPWDGGPIVVRRGPHVTIVVSRAHQDAAPRLAALAERGIAAPLAFRPGWDGKLLVIAVDDPAVFRSYFRGAAATTTEFEAITPPVDDEVDEWGSVATYVTSRVIYNPKYIDHPDDELLRAFAHEFTHAATANVTSQWTPQWMIEGIAEYVASNVDPVDDASVARRIRRIGVPAALPEAGASGDAFLTEDEYFLAWLACRLIAERYGPAKLIALYESTYRLDGSDPDKAFRQTLGLPIAQFTAQWRAYLTKLAR